MLEREYLVQSEEFPVFFLPRFTFLAEKEGGVISLFQETQYTQIVVFGEEERLNARNQGGLFRKIRYGNPREGSPVRNRGVVKDRRGKTNRLSLKKADLYEYLGFAGSLILVTGCFCPIDYNLNVSPAQLFFMGLSSLGSQDASFSPLQLFLCFALLLLATRCVMGAFLGQLHQLRIAGIQTWVVLVGLY